MSQAPVETSLPSAPAPAKPLSRIDWVADAIVRNWRTTGCAFVTAVAMFVASNPAGIDLPTWSVSAAQWLLVAGIFGIGAAAKDSSKSGNPGRPSA